MAYWTIATVEAFITLIILKLRGFEISFSNYGCHDSQYLLHIKLISTHAIFVRHVKNMNLGKQAA